MNIILTGVIESIFRDQYYGDFRKREFWVTEMGKETNFSTWQFEMHHDDCELLNKFKSGDVVSCTIEVRGKKLRKKTGLNDEYVITTLKCNGIKKI